MLNKLRNLRNRHFFILDILLIPVAAYLAFVLRLESFDLGKSWPAYVAFAFIALVALLLTFRWSGVYARYWRYASIEELLLLTGSVTLGAIVAGIVGIAIAHGLNLALPRSVPIIFLILALMVSSSPRLLIRILSSQPFTNAPPIRPKNVLIAGAGDAGQMLAREIRKNPSKGFQLVGFVDDDPEKQGLTARGIPILGGREAIPELVERMDIEEILIAMPSAPGAAVRTIVGICEDARVNVRILPAISEMLTDEVSLRHLRPVDINDLLRREPIQTDMSAVHDLVQDKIVLVTGAGGSIGSEICRQIAQAHPQQLILLGHGENSIFNIQNELHDAWKTGKSYLKNTTAIIADVRDRARLEQVFAAHSPEVVFHAAAHKHVPLMEANPIDAITNNILGAHALLETCLAHQVQRFVLISTDKAVNPANVMGVTKRMAELLVLDAAQRSGRPYVAVRFGNVLGSRGSVVPFFKKQIAAGGPVTVTHPEVSRYFMTIPEAVQLVLQAATLGRQGDLFMLDMGEPVKIVDLARDLIRLSGFKPDDEIKITFTGLRPGEKLKEELYQGHESHSPTRHPKILRVTSHYRQPAHLEQAMEMLRALTLTGNIEAALSLIASLIPEYTPPSGITPRSLEQLTAIQTTAPAPIALHARWY